MGKRELIALLNLSSWCLVMVERLFLAVPRGCLQFVIVVFPDHTHLLFFSVNMGPVQPPQRKGRIPQYARNKLVELQSCFDELEQRGVFKKPEDVGINVEYVNPSFLVKKPSGGHRLVPAFTDVGQDWAVETTPGFNRLKPPRSICPKVVNTGQYESEWSIEIFK